MKFVSFFLVCAIVANYCDAEDNEKLTRIELSSKVYSELKPQGRNVFVMVGIDGKFKQGWVSRSSDMFDGPLPFFESDQTIDELELSKDQKSKYEDAVGEWRIDLENGLKEWRAALKNGDKTKSKNAISKLDEIHKSGIESATETLLNHQRKRLSQIQIRYLIRTAGLVPVLKHKDVLKFTGLTNADTGRVESQARSNQGELSKQILEIQNNAVAKMFEPLSEEQRKKLFKKWPYLVDKKSPRPERLRIQTKFHDGFRELEKIESVFNKIKRFPEFELSVAGTFQPRFNSRPLNKGYDGYSKAKRFFDLMKTDDFVDYLGVTEEQLSKLRIFYRAYISQVNKASTISITWKGGTKEELEAMKKKMRGMMQSAGTKAMSDIESTLDETQMERFEGMADLALDKMYGPCYDLLHGSLGTSFELKNAKKQELKMAFKKALEEFEEATLEIEEKWFELSLKPLGEQKRSKFKNLIGDRLSKSPANLGMYLSGR